MFDEGDRVICINNAGYRSTLTLNKVYTIKHCWSEEHEDDDGEMQERWYVSLEGFEDEVYDEDMFEVCHVKKIERNLPIWF